MPTDDKNRLFTEGEEPFNLHSTYQDKNKVPIPGTTNFFPLTFPIQFFMEYFTIYSKNEQTYIMYTEGGSNVGFYSPNLISFTNVIIANNQLLKDGAPPAGGSPNIAVNDNGSKINLLNFWIERNRIYTGDSVAIWCDGNVSPAAFFIAFLYCCTSPQ